MSRNIIALPTGFAPPAPWKGVVPNRIVVVWRRFSHICCGGWRMLGSN